MEAKRGLTPEQREQISESEKHFIDGGITYAQSERKKFEATIVAHNATIVAHNATIDTHNANIARIEAKSVQDIVDVYEEYISKPDQQGLKTLIAMKENLSK